MLTLTEKPLLGRPRLRLTIAAVLASALAGGLLATDAPAPKAAAPKASVSTVCKQSVNTVAAALSERAPGVPTGPTVQSASFTIPARFLESDKQQAVTDCENQLGKPNAQQATWGYLPSRMAEIGVDIAITFFASTTICSYTGPVGCKWGVRFAAFTGGFFGSLVFQFMNTGYVDWSAAGYAFLDAAASMFTFSGLDSLSEGYIKDGVRDTWKNVYNLVKPVAVRISGLGNSFLSYVQDSASWMWNNVITKDPNMFWPTAYHGGGSFESVLSPANGFEVATSVQLRDAGYGPNIQGWSDNEWDLHSGAPGSNNYFYDWDLQRTNNFNNDGAISYEIAQGNNCLQNDGYNGSPVYFAPCNLDNFNQYWYVDGPELISNSGFCMNEVPSTGRWLTDCDGINYNDNPPTKDDQFMVTSDGGSPIDTSVSNWENDWQTYANA